MRFAELDARMAETVTHVFGEAFLFRPMASTQNVDAVPVPDALRSQILLVATYRDKPRQWLGRNEYDPRSDQRPPLVTGEPVIEIDPRDNPGLIDGIRKDDLLEGAPMRDGSVTVRLGKTFRVTSAPKDETGRILAHVVEL